MILVYDDTHYDMVMSWYEKRQMKALHPNVLSRVGFVVPDHCAVWIYSTDSDFCYLENLISNPTTEELTKEKGYVSLLIDTAIKAAQNLGFKFMLSITDHPGVIGRAIAKGAKLQKNQTLITYQIK